MPFEPPEFAIETAALRKTYRGAKGAPGKEALRGIDLKVPRGSIFGLLGPNGAGKSTLINILAGLVIKSAGRALVWGHDIEREMRLARAAIGVVPQEVNLDAFFTPREVMEAQAGLYGVPPSQRRTGEILAALSLADKADAYARSLSGGMRRRLLVAKALVHSPPVVVLDEPTAGVDVELRQSLWAYMRALNEEGVTIVLTTHYLEEAEAMCDHIAIIDDGAIVASDPTPVLLSRLDSKELALTLDREIDALPDALAAFGAEIVGPYRLVFRFRPSRTPIAAILDAVRAAGYGIADLTTREPALEDIFLQLTGLAARRAEEARIARGAGDPQAGTVALARSRPLP